MPVMSKKIVVYSVSSPDLISQTVAFLHQVPPFDVLTDKELAVLCGDLRYKEYPKDQTIFHQDDASRELYVVVSGMVRIFRVSPAGGETSINIYSTHDIIGEFSAIDDQPRSATAKAIVPSVLLELKRDQFMQRMREMPNLALAVTRLLIRKLRWTTDFAETVAQFDATGRLLHILLRYNQQYGQEIEPGKQYVLELGLSQSDLASLVGVRREWVNRILAEWQRQNLIQLAGNKIVILDLPRVQQVRDSHLQSNFD